MSNNDTQDVDYNEEFDDDDKVSHNKKDDNDVLAIQNIMRTEGGRDFIWKHLTSCGTYESTFNMNATQSNYNDGLRDAGLRLEREIKEAAPDDYFKMIKENM